MHGIVFAKLLLYFFKRQEREIYWFPSFSLWMVSALLMGNIICISNQKGGVGKTTVAVNLASALAIAEEHTLLIDLDFQGHATRSLGIDKKKAAKSIFDVLESGENTEDIIQETNINFLKLIPSGANFLKAELKFKTRHQGEAPLKKIIDKIKERFSYIIIDSPPAFSTMALDGINVSDSVLIPLQCEYLALESFGQYLKFFNQFIKRNNNHTRILGVLLNMYDPDENISSKIAREIINKFNGMAFNTKIPRSRLIRESASSGRPILLSDISSMEAGSFISFTREVIGRNSNQE